MERAREWLGAGRPLDGGSAKLSTEGTYREEIHNLLYDSREVIRWRTVFCSGLLDFPPSIA